MRRKKHIFLIGMPGSGKSTIGRLLSHSLNMPFIDSDYFIESATGKSVDQIFADSGEHFFRNLELIFLKNLPEGSHIIATGGGMPVDDDRFRLMETSGLIVYLKCDVKTLAYRLIKDQKNIRPMFKNLGTSQVCQKLELLLEKRLHYYEKAEMILDGQQSKKSVVKNLLNILKSDEYGNW